ncbi:MAG: protoheme IX farnesyltransferase [Gammaproteobacteria bacterium]|nr:protoheme IX farnesyltransferase [Gammaproteobacteria bacterium]
MNQSALSFITQWRDYLQMCKPRVVLLMLVTTYVGMHLAVPLVLVPWHIMVFGLLGIGLMAGSAAVINHIIDARIDAIMARTKLRPIPSGKISTRNAFLFSVILGVTGFGLLVWKVNTLTALLTLITLLGYAVIYTIFLKRSTPQNIVLGGLAGAMPPMLGWTAVTGQLDANSLLLVLIIFVWTPPHFWALAIYRYNEYAKVKDIPMLPVTHGIPLTKTYILIYTILLLVCSWLPFVVGMSGLTYVMGATILGIIFLYYAIKLKRIDDPLIGRNMFRYSIIYLLLLFVVMFVDHYVYYHVGV